MFIEYYLVTSIQNTLFTSSYVMQFLILITKINFNTGYTSHRNSHDSHPIHCGLLTRITVSCRYTFHEIYHHFCVLLHIEGNL